MYILKETYTYTYIQIHEEVPPKNNNTTQLK